MLLEFLKETAKLALIAVMLSFLLRRYLRWKRPNLATSAEEHRMYILLILGTVIAGIKVSELRAVERTLEEVFLTLTGEAA